MKKNQRANSTLSVLIILSAVSFGMFSIVSLIHTEFVLYTRTALNEDARQAAESLLQEGIIDIEKKLRFTPTITSDLTSENSRLTISDNFISNFNSGSSKNRLFVDNESEQTSELIIGEVSSAESYSIDADDPSNFGDNLRGMWVTQRNIELLSKATVENSVMGDSTAYARQVFAFRDVSLFNYAVFYNIPLEVSPGAAMHIHGKVHVNGDAYIASGDSLYFYDTVTISGKLYHQPYAIPGIWPTGNGPVYFTSDEGTFVAMREDDNWTNEAKDLHPGEDEFLQSDALSDEEFREMTNLIYGSGLQTSAHGVMPQPVLGFDPYIEDTNEITPALESYNHTYQLIQPALNKIVLDVYKDSTDPTEFSEYQKRWMVERQKYAYKAGLTIEVDASGNRAYYTYQRADNDLVYDALTGEPVKIYFNTEGSNPGNTAATTPSGAADTLTSHENFSLSGSTVTGGLWDIRENRGMNLINLDIGALRTLVEGNLATEWGGDDARKPENWWNGVVYVKFPQQGISRVDGVNPAIQGWGIRLINGKQIPDPIFAHSDNIFGMSLATNQMMYVQGHYNADGIITANSPTHADGVPSGTFNHDLDEAPAALISDAITLLSDNWQDVESSTQLGRTPGSLEISAAIITGIFPTGENGGIRISGGLQHFIRTLEHWNGYSINIRGSIAVLYETEVTRSFYRNAWSNFDGILLSIGIPTRNFGYHKGFEAGIMPPGTPFLRDTRMLGFSMISGDEYDTRLAELGITVE